METINTERLFIFGGAYGNLAATHAILKKAEQLGYTSSEILFTGDSIAYCANPEETAQIIRNSGIHTLMGNCEEAIANGADDCGCGFEEGTECDLLSDQWYNYCKSKISDESKTWMASLPENLTFSFGGFKMLAVHATPSSNNRFVFPSSLSNKVISGNKRAFDGYITGHSGIPFIGRIGKAVWLNSGAAGMPANDGTPRIWFATIELKSDTLVFQTYPLEYDYENSIVSMKENGLDNGYMDCLKGGIWPSHDVLPELEKSETGKEIKPCKLIQPVSTLVEV